MKFLVFLSLLVFGCAQKGGTRQQLNAILNELSELKSGQQHLGDKLEEQLGSLKEMFAGELDGQLHYAQEQIENQIGYLKDEMNSGLEKLAKKIESAQDKCEKRGVWNLGMNINPADGHIFGYTVGWATGTDIGSSDDALTRDYLNANTWALPANYIAIVRHQQGVVDAVKVFRFKILGESLRTRFGLKNMNPGRQIVTIGGPIQESIADDAKNLGDDPIFSVGGDLAFNWAYSDNGCRIALTGGHLSGAGVNDDNTHGLGNDFHVNPLANTAHSDWWPHDISNIQDCPLATCKDVKLQGTDHGRGPHLKSGPVYGNYAIYVSYDAEKFPKPGSKLSPLIEV